MLKTFDTTAASILIDDRSHELILKVVNCDSGDLLASTEAQANDKSHVLDALGKAASEMRALREKHEGLSAEHGLWGAQLARLQRAGAKPETILATMQRVRVEPVSLCASIS